MMLQTTLACFHDISRLPSITVGIPVRRHVAIAGHNPTKGSVNWKITPRIDYRRGVYHEQCTPSSRDQLQSRMEACRWIRVSFQPFKLVNSPGKLDSPFLLPKMGKLPQSIHSGWFSLTIQTAKCSQALNDSLMPTNSAYPAPSIIYNLAIFMIL